MTRLALLLLAGCAGCTPRSPAVAVGDPDPAPATEAVGRQSATPPDLTRLSYDPATRRLSLYSLGDRDGRWHVVRDDRTAIPVDHEYELSPEEATEPEGLLVYYALPGSAPSPMVSLREIADAHSAHAAR